ncbi:MAG TPA: hypothetical protein VJ783_05140 [Pirellulales bacterium]|nr:hypothetical protein [Pirellulales bacterium]
MSRSHLLRFTSLVRSASTARRHKKRRSMLPIRRGLEQLEDRRLLAGDLLVTTEVPGKVEYNLTQYTQQGAIVDSQRIPQSPTATELQAARGVTVDQNGNAHIVDGSFSPFLDTYSPGQQPAWSYQTAPGWIIGGNVSYGGLRLTKITSLLPTSGLAVLSASIRRVARRRCSHRAPALIR